MNIVDLNLYLTSSASWWQIIDKINDKIGAPIYMLDVYQTTLYEANSWGDSVLLNNVEPDSNVQKEWFVRRFKRRLLLKEYFSNTGK